METAVVMSDGSAVKYSAVDETVTVRLANGSSFAVAIDDIISAHPEQAAALRAGFSRVNARLSDPASLVELSSASLAADVPPPTPLGYPVGLPNVAPGLPIRPPGSFLPQRGTGSQINGQFTVMNSPGDQNSPFGPCSFAPCSPWTPSGFRGSIRVSFQQDLPGGGGGDPIDAYDRELFESWRRGQCEAAAGSSVPAAFATGGFGVACAVAAVSTGGLALAGCALAGAWLIYEMSQAADLARGCASTYPGRGNWRP